MIQLWVNSKHCFSWLTQLRLNSNVKFTNLTQFRLYSFESELSQIWLTTHHVLPKLAKSYWPGGSTVPVGWFFSCNDIEKLQNLNVFSSEKSMTQLWLEEYPVDSTLTQMTSSLIRLWLDSYPWFSRPTQLRLDSYSYVEHNPASRVSAKPDTGLVLLRTIYEFKNLLNWGLSQEKTAPDSRIE